MPQARRAALYLRVSRDGQTIENQRLALRQDAERRGWTIVAEYHDAGISGTKGRDKRPGLDSMLTDATKGKFDVLMSWALDRLGRSLADLITLSHELESARVDLYLQQQNIDTTTPAGRLFFHMMGSIAQFEREHMIERIRAGIKRARKEGKKLGAPRIPHEAQQKVRNALARGDTWEQIREAVTYRTGSGETKHVSVGSIGNISARMKSASGPTAPG